MKFKKKNRVLCWLTALALALALATPMTASADTIWEAPTQPMTVDDDIATIGVHAAAITSCFYLGGNVVTTRQGEVSGIWNAASSQAALTAAEENMTLGVFGSSVNQSPDPYWWNYFYNQWATVHGGTPSSEAVLPIAAGSPAAADVTTSSEYDGTSPTLYLRPDVLLGIAASGGTTYDALIADLPENKDGNPDNDYNPAQVAYDMTSLYSLSNTMYAAAKAMTDSGKTGRYGDPNTIAANYEKYLKGLQYYILSKIADGTIQKKKVVVVNPNPQQGGLYQAFDVLQGAGTAATVRGAEYLQYTTENLITELATTSGSAFYITPQDLVKADAIIAAGAQGAALTADAIKQNLINAGIKEAYIPPIYATVPQFTFGIVMNSVENIVGIPVFNGFVYPEVVNPLTDTMYVLDYFWHVKDQSVLRQLATQSFEKATLPAGRTYSSSAYNKAAVEEKIYEGLLYYKLNKAAIDNAYPNLTLTASIDDVTQYDLREAQVAAIPDAAYTGEAVTPEPTVTYKGRTLKKDRDYTVRYSNNVNAGTAGLTLLGKGLYKGEKAAAFKIIGSFSVAKIADQTYTGKAITPAVKVLAGATVLTKDTDYSVTYSKNINIGLAKATVTGKGSYSGATEITFRINPKKTRNFKLKAGKKAFTATWKKDAKATGYQIWYSTDKKVAKGVKKITVTKNKTVKNTVKKLKSNKTYYVKIRSYKTVSKVKYYSAWSAVKKVKTKK